MSTKAEKLIMKGPEAIRKATNENPLVVLYPRNRYRNAYLSRYLKNPDTGLYYYALQTSDRNLRKFLDNLIDDLNASTDGFGANLQTALVAKSKAPELAAALSEDLNALSSEPFTLLLDQYDRLPEKDETKRFMEALLDHIPPQCQILINSRDQAFLPWIDLVSTDKATLLGAKYVPEEDDGPIEVPEVPIIEVFSLGCGHTLVNGAPVTHWDGELPRDLFFFFMDHPLVTRDQIFDEFWPKLSVKEATNVFHVTKRKINERLGYDLTQYASGFYNHSDQINIFYDVAAFSTAVEEAEADEQTQETNWENAVQLYRAPFLHRMKREWAKTRRQELRRYNAQALIGLGRVREAQGRVDEALRHYTKALEATPEREDIHRQVMDLYYGQGDNEKAIEQYRLLERSLRESLNIAPSPETQNLYKLITGAS